jgi:YbbR domain-containing protein
MRDFFAKDIVWKLISLFLAVTIYFTVQEVRKGRLPDDAFGQWETKTFTDVPVIIMSAAADRREFKVFPDQVNVTIRARPEVMSSVVPREIEVHVDLTDVESARNLRQRVVVSLPTGVTLVRSSPNEVSVVVPPRKS